MKNVIAKSNIQHRICKTLLFSYLFNHSRYGYFIILFKIKMEI